MSTYSRQTLLKCYRFSVIDAFGWGYVNLQLIFGLATLKCSTGFPDFVTRDAHLEAYGIQPGNSVLQVLRPLPLPVGFPRYEVEGSVC